MLNAKTVGTVIAMLEQEYRSPIQIMTYPSIEQEQQYIEYRKSKTNSK